MQPYTERETSSDRHVTHEPLLAAYDEAVANEATMRAVREVAAALVAVAAPIWGKGDGEGGLMFDALHDAVQAAGLRP